MKKILLLSLSLLLLTACSNDSATTSNQNINEHHISDETTNSSAEIDHSSDKDVFVWENQADGIKITDYKGDSAEVIVPDTIDNKSVVSVGNAFNGNIKITSLTLPYKIDQANLENCSALQVLTLETNQLASVHPAFRLPQTLKVLNCTQLPDIYASIVAGTKVENIYAPSATQIYKGYWMWPSTLKEVTLSAEMLYYGIDNDTNKIGSLSIEYNTSDKNAITDENRAFVYCSFFGQNEIKVNGKLYTYNGELG